MDFSVIEEYKFMLFIAGMTPGSIRAIENIRDLCDTFLKDKYNLEVIDIYQQKHLVKEMSIIAVPTLIRTMPMPEKRMIGDMLSTRKIISFMEIRDK